MLIYIDNTIGEYLQSNNLDGKQTVFFSSLALSYRQGKCIVFGHIGSIEALIKQFGTPIDGIFRSILSKYSEIGSIAKWIENVFVITCNAEAEFHSKLPADMIEKSKILSLEAASCLNWSNGSCFVGENITDCMFYEIIGKYYSKSHKIRNVSVFFHKEHGGGGDTASVYEKCVKTDLLPTLCITDGDMKYGPTKAYGEPPKGGTFNACNEMNKQLHNEGYGAYCFYSFINAHEIENLVPLSLLKELGADVCSSEGISILEELEKIDNGIPILFYDFKSGEVIDLSSNHGKYWDSVFSQSEKYHEDNHYCNVVCSHFMDRVNDHIKSNGLVCISLNPYLIDVWDALGRTIFSWGCASCPASA